MKSEGPAPILPAEHAARSRRVRRLAKQFGFAGKTEYRHVYSRSGGAQYSIGVVESQDLLTVFAEAFERAANPDDFSLEAIVAHERGHEIVCRSAQLNELLGGTINLNMEEVLASLADSLLVGEGRDENRLILKAAFEAVESGVELRDAIHFVYELRRIMELII
jgi:hypothetical protein